MGGSARWTKIKKNRRRGPSEKKFGNNWVTVNPLWYDYWSLGWVLWIWNQCIDLQLKWAYSTYGFSGQDLDCSYYTEAWLQLKPVCVIV